MAHAGANTADGRAAVIAQVFSQGEEQQRRVNLFLSATSAAIVVWSHEINCHEPRTGHAGSSRHGLKEILGEKSGSGKARFGSTSRQSEERRRIHALLRDSLLSDG